MPAFSFSPVQLGVGCDVSSLERLLARLPYTRAGRAPELDLVGRADLHLVAPVRTAARDETGELIADPRRP